jgi:amicyanin
MQRPEPPPRPTPPKRPQMGGGYGGMAKPPMPGYQRAPKGYGAPQAYSTPAPASAAAAAPATDTASVAISQMQFRTPTVTIKTGGTVTWTNNEAVPHTVTADDGSFGSAQLGAGATFSHTFDEAGTYSYYCQLHPMMRATVVVVD